MARIYLAGSYVGARNFLRDEVTPVLQQQGHKITSRWLFEDHSVYPGLPPAELRERRIQLAADDLYDIDTAQQLWLFTTHDVQPIKGGKYVEWGYALAKIKWHVLIGPITNVFTELYDLRWESWEDYLYDTDGSLV